MKDFDIRKALIDSGTAEFLDHGFEKASLRTICKNAKVTTGAFYSYFEKKEDLFSAIVDPMLEAYHELYFAVVASALSGTDGNRDTELRIIEFICAHKDEFMLLFECADGTRYAGFRDRLHNDLFMPTYQACFDKYAECAVDPAVVRVFMHMKYTQYMELVYGGYSMEQIRNLVQMYAEFTNAGFISLINCIRKKNI